MDIKTRILRWEHSIQDNPAVLALGIIVALAVVFIGAIYLDVYLKARKRKKRKRG
ncbi:MAG TPA: hypothetical protein VG754_02310 [Verrucomicrobiae bacterium]|jgi:hypothetical protein|nr:hypothetical protein [Verrucomicrobiae bacterium]